MQTVTLKYTGRKARIPVQFPIGVKRLSGVTQTLFADPYIKLIPRDAEKLLKLHNAQFEVWEEEPETHEAVPYEDMPEPEPRPDMPEEAPVPKRKRGRPKKSEAVVA